MSNISQDIQKYCGYLRDIDMHTLISQYFSLFGHPPPRTNDRTWLYFNCAYKFQEKHYVGGNKIPEEVKARGEKWYHKLTREMESEVDIGKLKVADLKILCKKHGQKWDGKQRKKIVKELAWLECSEMEQEEPPTESIISGAKKGKGSGKRGRPRKADDLPDNIKELLERKAGASKEDQRLIRRKLRALDPDWKAKYS